MLCDDPRGPVVRHRVRALEPALRATLGALEVRYLAIPRRLAARIALFRTLRDADAVLLVRKLFTWAELSALRACARRLVYDFDDAVMYRDPFRGRPVSHVRRRRFRHTVRSADAVCAGNAYLAGIAGEDAPGTPRAIVPTTIDTERFTPGDASSTAPRIGWIGSRATRGYLAIAAPALRAVVAARPGATVAVMADALPSELDGISVEFTPWSEEGEVAFLRSLRVGIMPLSDDLFSRGKCGFKLLQYMACGVPAVASPVGVNVDLCDGGRAGALAPTPADWEREILRVLDDPDAARRTAERARRRVEERWSHAAAAPHLAAALRGGSRG